jgi:peptidoglycan/LPS O-acetylase OafA/YrhL
MNTQTKFRSKTGESRIPSLDGLRAISITMVLASHGAASIPVLAKHPLLLYTAFNGNRGVSVFFVISGFLITSLLLKEERSTGTVSLKGFYIRRAFRILPPFWFYLATLVVLWKLGAIHTSWADLRNAVIFVRDYTIGDWWTGHSWSLSVEEQFYLLWPAALVLSGTRRAKWIALSLIAAAPAVRILSQLFLASKIGHDQTFMFHMRVDTLMFGCALAMLYKTPWFTRIASRVLTWPGVLIALFHFGFLSGYLMNRFQGYYLLTVGYTLDGVAISYLLLYFVTRPASLGGRILNSRMFVHVGLISYSLYLWQQLLLTPPQDALARSIAPVLGTFPFNLLLAVLAAELSWKLVEKPALNLRRQFEGARSSKQEVDVQAVTILPADPAELAS